MIEMENNMQSSQAVHEMSVLFNKAPTVMLGCKICGRIVRLNMNTNKRESIADGNQLVIHKSSFNFWDISNIEHLFEEKK